jgi:DNA invertase Pin-like site-specific DNA recombinase
MGYTIAKYIRLSIDDAKTESLSIENQRLYLDSYIAGMDENDVTVLEFVDNGYSGTHFERPAIQELLELVRSGSVNCIIVKDFSRFGRNMIEAGYFLQMVFPLFKTRFISVSDNFDSQVGDAGGLDVAFKLLISECYSKDISVKIKSAKRAKALSGEFVTKNCVFGYKKVGNRRQIIRRQTPYSL